MKPFAAGGADGADAGVEEARKRLLAAALDADKAASGGAKWDQFAANAALASSSGSAPRSASDYVFDASAYTSQLDTAAFTPEQLARADAIASAITSDTTSHAGNRHVRADRDETGRGAADSDDEEGDEEARHSAVASSGAAPAAGVDAFTDAGVARAALSKGAAGDSLDNALASGDAGAFFGEKP